MIFTIFVFGAVFGSFLSALTWRLPKNLSIRKGRSICPKCKKKIVWYDNIPLLSFLFLRGKCRYCKKNISFRYPAIELTTALVFTFSYLVYTGCISNTALLSEAARGSSACLYVNSMGVGGLIFMLFIMLVMIAIFFIDLEKMVIYDFMVTWPFAAAAILIAVYAYSEFHSRMFAGFASATFLLILHLVTKGRGMGLGDVKLAVLAGLLLGINSSVAWMFLSFVFGAVIGVFLLLTGKAKIGKNVPFGPFLVTSFVLTFWFGEYLFVLLFPFYQVGMF